MRGTFDHVLSEAVQDGIAPKEIEDFEQSGARLPPDPNRPQRMGIMVTKEPHCLEAILQQVRAKKLRVEPVVVISNRIVGIGSAGA